MKRYISAAVRSLSEESKNVRQSLARDIRTSPGDLARLFEDPDIDVVAGVAKNPRTPHDVLYKLATADNAWLRKQLCRNSNLPEDVALVLADDPDEYVREELAHNPNLSLAVINKLANDQENRVLCAVVLNHNTPSSIRKRLSARLKSYYIRMVFYGYSDSDTPLSDLELKSRKDLICNNPVVSKYNMLICSVENRFIEDFAEGIEHYIGYCIYLKFSLMGEDEAGMVSDTIESLLASSGDTLEECYWDTEW